MSINHDKIKRLISLVEQHKLTELAVEEDGLSIIIKAEQAVAPTISIPAAHADIQADEVLFDIPVADECQEIEPEAGNENLVSITSPMIGVFYRRPSPDSPPFVDIGDDVEVGQTIGLIEAMKVFSEVPSEVAGKVVQTPAESGKLVQQGDILVVIDTSFEGLEHSGG